MNIFILTLSLMFGMVGAVFLGNLLFYFAVSWMQKKSAEKLTEFIKAQKVEVKETTVEEMMERDKDVTRH